MLGTPSCRYPRTRLCQSQRATSHDGRAYRGHVGSPIPLAARRMMKSLRLPCPSVMNRNPLARVAMLLARNRTRPAAYTTPCVASRCWNACMRGRMRGGGTLPRVGSPIRCARRTCRLSSSSYMREPCCASNRGAAPTRTLLRRAHRGHRSLSYPSSKSSRRSSSNVSYNPFS